MQTRKTISSCWRIEAVKPEPRNITMKFHVSEREKEMIRKRMELSGIINQSAFLRKQAIDGYIILLEAPDLLEFVKAAHQYCDLLNNIARRVNETNRFYDSDMEEIRTMSKKLLKRTQDVFNKLLDIQRASG